MVRPIARSRALAMSATPIEDAIDQNNLIHLQKSRDFSTTLEMTKLRLSHRRGRSGLRGLCLPGCRCCEGREFLFEWCGAADTRRKRDRNLRAPTAPWQNP